MSDPVVSVDDFGLYLNNQSLDEDRASFILTKAQQKCENYINRFRAEPIDLPAIADTIVLDVAERAFANPTGVANTNLGLYSEGEGPFSEGTPGTTGGGLWLTAENKKELDGLVGKAGGAFTIDTLPADYAPVLPPWDVGFSEACP